MDPALRRALRPLVIALLLGLAILVLVGVITLGGRRGRVWGHTPW